VVCTVVDLNQLPILHRKGEHEIISDHREKTGCVKLIHVKLCQQRESIKYGSSRAQPAGQPAAKLFRGKAHHVEPRLENDELNIEILLQAAPRVG
jgi:hypothetical protein